MSPVSNSTGTGDEQQITELDPWRAVLTALVFAAIVVIVIRPLKFRLRGREFELDFSIAPILGTLILLITTCIGMDEVVRGLVGDERLRPYGILILFNSLAYLCISLDLTGAFSYIALVVTQRAKGRGRMLFLSFFALSSALTVATSNDIVILTLTPIIATFARETRSDPMPYLFAQFFAANIWSAALFIGNPTNIIVGEAFRIPFLEYSVWQVLPTILSGLTCLGMLVFLYWRRVPERVEVLPTMNPSEALKSKSGAYFGLSWLALCLVFLVSSSWIAMPLWAITLVFGMGSLIRDLIADHSSSARAREAVLTAPLDDAAPDPEDRPHVTVSGYDMTELVQHPAKDQRIAVSSSSRLDGTEGHGAAKHAPAPVGESLRISARPSEGADPFASPPPIPVSTAPRPAATTTVKPAPTSALGRWYADFAVRYPTVAAANDRMPWKIVPFVIGMFIQMEALKRAGWVDLLAGVFSSMIGDSVFAAVMVMGIASTLACNLLNNQPMTILFTSIMRSPAFTPSGRALQGAVYAVISGSNWGANLTLIGALAGIMWAKILDVRGYSVTYLQFARMGFIVMPAVVMVGFLTLYVELIGFSAEASWGK